jgi:hypothetical protein
MSTLTQTGCTPKQHDLILRLVAQIKAAETSAKPETVAAVTALIGSIGGSLAALISPQWATVDRRATSQAIDTLLAAQRLIDAGQPRRNAHPGNCSLCGQSIPAQAGLLLGRPGAWEVRHDGPCPEAAPAAPPAPPVPLGLHQHPDGRIVKVYVTGTGNRAGKVLLGSSFRYQKGAIVGLSDATLMTAEQAKKYGRTTGHCCNCSKKIGEGDTVSTLISLAQGYGPDCAKRNGWPTLSADNAVAVLLADGIDHPLLAQFK